MWHVKQSERQCLFMAPQLNDRAYVSVMTVCCVICFRSHRMCSICKLQLLFNTALTCAISLCDVKRNIHILWLPYFDQVMSSDISVTHKFWVLRRSHSEHTCYCNVAIIRTANVLSDANKLSECWLPIEMFCVKTQHTKRATRITACDVHKSSLTLCVTTQWSFITIIP